MSALPPKADEHRRASAIRASEANKTVTLMWPVVPLASTTHDEGRATTGLGRAIYCVPGVWLLVNAGEAEVWIKRSKKETPPRQSLFLLDIRPTQFVSRLYAARPTSVASGNRCDMTDIVLTLFALALFAASVGYAYVCERL